MSTPYSDEFTLGASALILDDTLFKIQAVKRNYRDQLKLAEPKVKCNYYRPDGSCWIGSSDSITELDNGGRTDYKGLTFSIEKTIQTKGFGKHHGALDITRSSLKGNMQNSWATPSYGQGDPPYDPLYIIIDGNKTFVGDMNASNFNSDWVITYTHDASFFDDRLRSTILARYESPADRLIRDKSLDQWNTNNLQIRGYRKDQQKSLFNIDLTLAYDLYRTQQSSVTMEVQVLNLFDRSNMLMTGSNSSTYSMGRQFFLGLSARY